MLSTTASYLAISNNLAAQTQATASTPTVETATANYLAALPKITSISDFVNNYQVFSYAMKAFGLEDMTYAKGLVTQILQQGTSSSSALANQLDDPRYIALANAFSYLSNSPSSSSSSPTAITPPASATTTTVNNYVQQSMDDNAGDSNPGVQLALYFQQNASSVTNVYGLLADTNLLKVVQTAFGLPPSATVDIDSEAATLSKYVSMSDLQNPTKVQQIAERFTAMYDLGGNNTSASSSTTLTSQLFAGSSTTSGLSDSLLLSIQGLQLGGA